MKTSTRLILLLTVTVGAMMAVAGYFILREREATLREAMRDEVYAHARTLQIVLEDDFSAGRDADAQRLIDQLSDNPKIYGVVLFDAEGRVAMLSDPLIPDEIRYPEEVAQVISTGSVTEIEREISGLRVFSVIMPLRVGAIGYGAFEIAQPLSFVESDISRARREMVLMALLLFGTIFIVVLVVTRKGLQLPIQELLRGAAAVGRGDLGYRVKVPRRGGEFAQLAREFNRMADGLAEQRGAAMREAEERLALERALQHSERLSTVGRLATGIAHEMGAPLNVIYTRAAQLLGNPAAPLDTRQRNLTIIRAQAERITRIVRQLLDLAHPGVISIQPVNLSEVVATALELVENDAARANVRVEFAPADALIVDVDKDLLQQVLLNVCLNAIQAMPGGGLLRVECFEDEATGQERRLAAIRVSDTGTGIAPEHLDHIFEPFYTTKEVGRGTGLGLAVSRRIVEEHQGRITAANNAEGGATFTIYLPRSGSVSDSPAKEYEKEGANLDDRAIIAR
ncbi:MAG TPA: ATP-binding protein [Blastocatellia bacterium]|nr:ATP-binding protein [Blastocatellia bacterium]